jgi:hypothetical protein
MINEISPRTMARYTGISYLIVIVFGVFAQGFVADRLINFKDAGITASNILANQSLYRIGYTVYLIEMTAQIVNAVLFYYLLKPVSRSGAMVATVVTLAGSVIKTMARVFFIVPLGMLHSGGSVYGSYSPEQVSALSLVLLRINDEGAGLALAFFGPATFIQGWLIMKSTFLPRWLGIIGIIGGIAWTTFYWPALGRSLFMFSAVFGLVSSVATIAWLIVRGVDQPRWFERATASASSIWA